MQPTPRPDYVPALRYRWLTPFYDVAVRVTTREGSVKRALIEQAGIRPGDQVLDLAAGTGTLAIWIKQLVPMASVTGVDGDPAVLSRAGRKAREAGVAVRFDDALSYDLPYPTACFDCVVSSLLFHHLKCAHKRRTAREALRVLKPGGAFHVADWGRPSNALMRALFLPVQLLDGFPNTQHNASGKLVQLLAEAGFVDVSLQRSFNTLFGTMALYRAVRPA